MQYTVHNPTLGHTDNGFDFGHLKIEEPINTMKYQNRNIFYKIVKYSLTYCQDNRFLIAMYYGISLHAFDYFFKFKDVKLDIYC